MSGQTVLLRVVDGSQEGWLWIAHDEFLRRIRLEEWHDGQRLIGMILPPGSSVPEAVG